MASNLRNSAEEVVVLQAARKYAVAVEQNNFSEGMRLLGELREAAVAMLTVERVARRAFIAEGNQLNPACEYCRCTGGAHTIDCYLRPALAALAAEPLRETVEDVMSRLETHGKFIDPRD